VYEFSKGRHVAYSGLGWKERYGNGVSTSTGAHGKSIAGQERMFGFSLGIFWVFGLSDRPPSMDEIAAVSRGFGGGLPQGNESLHAEVFLPC